MLAVSCETCSFLFQAALQSNFACQPKLHIGLRHRCPLEASVHEFDRMPLGKHDVGIWMYGQYGRMQTVAKPPVRGGDGARPSPASCLSTGFGS